MNLQKLFGEILQGFADSIPKIFGAIIIIIIGVIIAKLLKKIIQRVLETIGIDKLGEKLNEIEMVNKADVKIKFSAILAKIVYYMVLLVFLMAATSQLEMEAVSNLVQNLIEFVPNFSFC